MSEIPLEPEDSGYIQVEGGKIWYRQNGLRRQNKTPVLIIHGGPGSTHNYLLPCLTLAQDRPVIFYDQLDCGLSEHPNNPQHWHLDRFTHEITDIRQHLSLDKLHIIASSWGGAIAINYARNEVQGLQSLTLSGPLLNSPRWVSDNERYRQRLPTVQQDRLIKYEIKEEYDHIAYQQAVDFYYHRHLCRLSEWPACVNDSVNRANQVLYRTMWGPTEFLATGTLKALDLTPYLTSIAIPTLFIAGEFDEGTPQANHDFARMMPAAESFVVPNASHMPHVEQPDIFFPQVGAFLAGCE